MTNTIEKAKNYKLITRILLKSWASLTLTLLGSSLILSTPALTKGEKIVQYSELNTQDSPSFAVQKTDNKVQKLDEQGATYFFREAIAQSSEEALSVSTKAGNIGDQANSFLYFGNVYRDLGEDKLAIEHYKQALPLLKSIGDISGEANALTGIGNVYRDLGVNKLAIEHYNQALPLFRDIGDVSGEATAITNIGNVYRNLGENKLAIENYNQALLLFKQMGDIDREASTLIVFGNVYSDLGESKLAIENYNQALPLLRQTGDASGEAKAFTGLGNVYSNLGENKLAVEYYTQALPLLRQTGDAGGEAKALTGLGNIYRNLGERELAIRHYQQALPSLRKTGDSSEEATNLYNIASLKYSQGYLTESLQIIEESLAIIEDAQTKVNTKVHTPENRASYFARVQDRYEFYIKLLMELHQQQPNQGFDVKAFHASERSRARTLLELLTEASVDIRQGVEPKLLRREHELQKLLNRDIKQGLIKRDKLIELYELLRARIRTTSPNYTTLTQPKPLTLAEVQQQVLDDDTLLLQYSLGEANSYLWAVTKDSINSYQLPGRKKIKNAAIEFSVKITNPYPPERDDITKIDSAADALTEIILKPVADKLNKKRLLIVADGFLQYISFSALSIPNTSTETDGYQPLIVNYEIVNLPSITTIATIRKHTASRKLPQKKLAIIADPVFSPNDARVIKKTATTSRVNTESTVETHSLIFHLDAQESKHNIRDSFPPIPGSRKEAEAILAMLPETEQVYAFFDFEANLNIFTNQELAKYQIVHIATHGFADRQRPGLSSLVMSLVDRNGNWQYGYLLSLNDIFNLELPVELVVLSAANTISGKYVPGEGIIGLTRGFISAGAKRVVGSLYPIHDDATVELMKNFYRGILQQGLSPVEALRVTQLQMWQQGGKYHSPYYWAAFTLQGEWQ